jgi:protein tyrosine kinase modulator
MTKRPDPWARSPDDSQQAAPVQAVAEAEGIEAVAAQIDRLRPLLRRCRRHAKFGIIGVVVATLLVGGYAMFVFNPAFESETVVFYQPDMNPESLGQQQGRVDPTFMRELLLRRTRLEALIEELGLHTTTVKKHGMAVAVDEMQRTVKFKPVGKSTFRISYIGDSPEEARDVTAWLANQLVAEELDRRQKQALKTKAFLDKELTRTNEGLAASEEKLGEFIARHPRFATTATSPGLPAPKASPNPSPASRPRPAGGRGRRTKPGPASPAPKPKAKEPDPKLVAARDAAIQELTRASRQLAQLQTTYTDVHPEVQAAKARVADAEQKVQAATQAVQIDTADDMYDVADTAPPPPAPASAEPAPRPRPVAAQPRPRPKAVPTSEPKPLSPPDGEVGGVETEWMRLKRSVDEARERQDRLAAESFRAEVRSRSQSAGHSARVVVLDEAYLPAKPLRSRLFFGKIGAPLALILAVVIVLGRALIDDRIYDADDLASLGLSPVLSVIPPRKKHV